MPAHRLENNAFKVLIENSYDIVALLDTNATIIYSSPSVKRVLGYTHEEILGKNAIAELVHPDDMSLTKEKLGLLLKDPSKLQTAEFRLKHKDRTWRWVEATGNNLLTNPDVEAIVVNYHDITKIKELENAKDEFVSMASHELRTPLTAVKGYISVILDGDYGSVPQNLINPLKAMSLSIERLLNLVNDLLDTSRIESGKMKFSFASFNLSTLVQDVTSSLLPIAKQKNINLHFENNILINVDGDLDKTRQILENIIGNALKYTEKGSVSITLKKENNFAYIFIKDTGIGITPEDKENLFNKFQQTTTKEKRKGTGLGLFLSREMARKLNGDLKLVESNPGKGSTFSVSLPLSKV